MGGLHSHLIIRVYKLTYCNITYTGHLIGETDTLYNKCITISSNNAHSYDQNMWPYIWWEGFNLINRVHRLTYFNERHMIGETGTLHHDFVMSY